MEWKEDLSNSETEMSTSWRDHESKASSDCAASYIASQVNSEEDIETKDRQSDRWEGRNVRSRIYNNNQARLHSFLFPHLPLTHSHLSIPPYI